MLRNTIAVLLLISLLLTGVACTVEDAKSGPASTVPIETPSPSPTPTSAAGLGKTALTLPLVDALFFADDQFATELQTKLDLTAEQTTLLRTIAREETSQLREAEGDYAEGSTLLAIERAAERISAVIGEAKMANFSTLVVDHWQHHSDGESSPDAIAGATPEASPSLSPGSPGATPTASASPSPSAMATPMVHPFAPPTDTRIVVNAPAYRMDVFENGQLVRSYRIGIGYPEFPLPAGMRYARSIIFNPTWTPPDEPWVESRSSKVKVGRKVAAGSKLNPLGLAKIPIGMPSLIHGGKSEAQLGSFASHGCVGLTNAQLEDFTLLLARIGGASLTAEQIAGFKKKRTVTKEIKLVNPVPVELRYQTIIAEDGKLYIYRDVYDQGTNTEGNLKTVLDAWNVSFDELGDKVLTQAQAGLAEMSRDARGRVAAPTPNPETSPGAVPAVTPTPKENKKENKGSVTRTFKGRKEVVVAVAALSGLGYPSPIALETRRARK